MANVASHCAQQPAFSSIVGASTQASMPPMHASGDAPRRFASRTTATAHRLWQHRSNSLTA